MMVEWDEEADAAYIEISSELAAEFQISIEDARLLGQVILDFDKSGKLAGIEIIGAEALLTATLLEGATILE